MCNIYIYLIYFTFNFYAFVNMYLFFHCVIEALLYAHHCWPWVSQVALEVENLPANVEDLRDVVWSLGGEDPLEEGMATHSSILAWISSRTSPWTKELGRLQSIESQSQTLLGPPSTHALLHMEIRWWAKWSMILPLLRLQRAEERNN